MFLRRLFAVFLVFSIVSVAFAAFDQFPPGARTGGLGLAFVALADDPTAAVENPAGLAFLPGPQFCTFYSRPFGLKELETAFFGSAVPLRRFGLGFALNRFGGHRYHETTGFFTLAWRATSRFSVGVSLFFDQLNIPNYWQAHASGINLGYFYRVSPRLFVAGSVKNANHASLSHGENLPQELNAGVAYRLRKTALVSFQASKTTRFPVSLRTGVEWTFFRRITLRSGFLTQPARFTAGFGLRFGRFRLDYAYLSHSTLGGTQQISLSFR